MICSWVEPSTLSVVTSCEIVDSTDILISALYSNLIDAWYVSFESEPRIQLACSSVKPAKPVRRVSRDLGRVLFVFGAVTDHSCTTLPWASEMRIVHTVLKDYYHTVFDDPKLSDAAGKRYFTTCSTFTPQSDQFQISPAASPEYNFTQYGELGSSSLTQLKDDYTTDSHYLIIYTFLVKSLGECTFWTWEWKRSFGYYGE